jgi:hypothetical protein
VQLTYEDAFYVPQITNATSTARCTPGSTGQDNNVLAVNGADRARGQNKGQKGGRSAMSSPFTDIAWGAGSHTIKAGVKYKDVDLTAADSIPGNPVFLLRRNRRRNGNDSVEERVRAAACGIRVRGHYQ